VAEPALDSLIEALQRLPGIGRKSAQRIAFHLLQHDRGGAQRWRARCSTRSTRCGTARAATPSPKPRSAPPAATRRATRACCAWWRRRPTRRRSSAAAAMRGCYYVLMGRLSPLDGIGVEALQARGLLDRAADGVVRR
jgi:recombination protein RecR